MARPNGRLDLVIVPLLIWFQTSLARLINTTIFDTNVAHISYEPRGDFCVRWTSSWWYGQSCELWAQPWSSEVYYNHGQFVGVHRGLNHRLVSMAIEFEGSAIWIYGPPRARLTTTPPDYKICVQEAHPLASDETCYRVDVAAAYSAAERYDEPVVIFVQGGLRRHAHRVVISVGDPINNTRAHLGIQFSHAVYTTERPTPWPVEEDKWRFRQVTMHNTHPQLSYYPTPQSSDCPPIGCSSLLGWTPRTYHAEDGTVVSWHELRSRNEPNRDQWGVEARIIAGSVAVYGIPKAHITNTDYLSQICVRINSGQCEMVDVQHAYINVEHTTESVLLWKHDALDPSRKTQIAIRLVKTEENNMSVFPFKAIEYYEPQEYATPGWSIGHPENIAVPHDHERIVYHPGGRCVRHFGRKCTKWYDPWVWREEGPWGNRLTYRSTVWSYRTSEDPSIEFDFQGSAVYVYGAPKPFIKSAFASQHICINDVCRIVDVEQAYLNAPTSMGLKSQMQPESNPHDSTAAEDHLEAKDNTTAFGVHSEYEPVLIWSMTGLDDQVSHKLWLALAALPSDDNAEMSIVKVVYTKTTYDPGESRPDSPVPQPDPRFEGPVHPPYARPWVPRRSFPPPPSSPRLPHPVTPPYQHENPPIDHPSSTVSQVAVIIASIMLSFLVLCVAYLIYAWLLQNEASRERKQLRRSNYTYYG